MDINQIIGGFAGIAFHIIAVKLPSYKAKCIAGNIPFTASGYLKEDWLPIMGSAVTVLIAVWGIDEILSAYPPIQKYIKFFMVFIGFTGSSILIAWLGRASATALKIIDTKTNALRDMTDGKSDEVINKAPGGSVELVK